MRWCKTRVALGCIVVEGGVEFVGAEPVVEVGDKTGDGQVRGDVRKWAPALVPLVVKSGNDRIVACCFEGHPCATEGIRRKYRGIAHGVVRRTREIGALMESRRGKCVGGVWVPKNGRALRLPKDWHTHTTACASTSLSTTARHVKRTMVRDFVTTGLLPRSVEHQTRQRISWCGAECASVGRADRAHVNA